MRSRRLLIAALVLFFGAGAAWFDGPSVPAAHAADPPVSTAASTSPHLVLGMPASATPARDFIMTLSRGHLCTSEDRTSSRAANDATFNLINVLPQEQDLNAGPWLRLEELSRKLAQHDGHVLHIVAGGIYAAAPKTIGHGIAVPSHFWKVVVVLEEGQGPETVTPATKVISVIMPNVSGILGQKWMPYRTTLAEVEQRAGFRLLDRVAPAVKAQFASAPGWTP